MAYLSLSGFACISHSLESGGKLGKSPRGVTDIELDVSWELSWSFNQSTYIWPLNVSWASKRIQIELFHLGASQNSAFQNIWSCKLEWGLIPELRKWHFFPNLLKQSPGLFIVKGLEKKMEFLDERMTMSCCRRAQGNGHMVVTLSGRGFFCERAKWMFVSPTVYTEILSPKGDGIGTWDL